ncbi:MAG: nuclear transport factor 2 family protein [Patulibacter sp.]|nr:nuclear transport factor 2 family protein [Patulibacter sp.]
MPEVSIEDRILIRELYDRYHWALNTGDADGVAACFVPDGSAEFVHHDGGTSSPDGMVRAAIAWQADPVGRTRQHHVGTFVVDPDPDGRPDRRAVRCYFLVTEVEHPPEIRVRWSCFSRDLVERVDGAWYMRSRAVTLNHDGTA